MSGTNFLEIVFEEKTESVIIDHRKRILPFANSTLFEAPIAAAKFLTEGDDVKTVIDLTLSTKVITYNFYPGNTLGVLPQNDEDEVKQLLQRLGYEDKADTSCMLKLSPNIKKVLPKHLPPKATLKQIFMECVDVRSPPKKILLKMLSMFSSDEDAENLLHLCSPSGSEEYNKLICVRGKTLLNLLCLFPSSKPPIERLLELLPPLQPRPYSISSSPLLGDVLHFTFTVIQCNKDTKGVCTGFLERKALSLMGQSKEPLTGPLSEPPKIKFYFRKPTNFQLPEDPSTPIIMIGPGTGIAPFIGFLQHLSLQKIDYVTTWLFYGCRYVKRDFLYKDEIKKFTKENILHKLSVASSRDGNKEYVQDHIKKNSSFFAELVQNNATIYVCGDAKNMANDVKAQIKAVLAEQGVDVDIAQLEKDNRYITDSWL